MYKNRFGVLWTGEELRSILGDKLYKELLNNRELGKDHYCNPGLIPYFEQRYFSSNAKALIRTNLNLE